MCAIIDNNVRDVFFKGLTPDFEHLLRWIATGDGRIVIGGKLKSELEGSAAAVGLLTEWGKSKKVKVVSDDLVAAEARGAWAARIRSDDPHVLALARVSGARILATAEQTGSGNLSADFRNPRIISQPRGFVYKKPSHRRALGHSGSCGMAASGIWKDRA